MHTNSQPTPRTRRRPVACGLAAVLATLLILVLAVPVTVADASGRWLQWGGPNGDFHAPSDGLASSWGDSGPPELWSRQLGDGYSAILVDGGRLYTMYRKGDREAVIALDAATGKTVWEHAYDSAPSENHVSQFGDGPRATPLISGDRIYTIGVSGVMHSLKTGDGSVVWTHDLWGELGGSFLSHGYSSSPVEHGDTVIALVGGEGHALVAFNKDDGAVAWKGLDFGNSYSTPQVVEVHGKDQLVTFMADELIGVDPSTGELQWRYPVGNQFKQNINMPVVTDGQYVFLSTLQAGSRGLKLVAADGKTEVEELWSTRKIQFYHVTTVREGDWVYGTTGSSAPYFMSAINVKTGEIGWRERGFTKSNCVGADGKLVILDEDGKLSLATATPQGLTVLSETQLLDKVSWTSPTIVGKTLYVRDKKSIQARNLG